MPSIPNLTRGRSRPRRGRLPSPAAAVLALAICLLTLGVGSAVSERNHTSAALDRALETATTRELGLINSYFLRARSVSLLTMNNPAFREFYERPGRRGQKIRAGGA